MKLFLSLALNALLLLLFVYWLRRAYCRALPTLRRWLLPALGWRLLLTAASSILPSLDARDMSFWSQGLTASFWAHPASALALWKSSQISAQGQVLAKYSLSNTVFFIKVLGLLNLASQGSLVLNAWYLSLFCFVGCWVLTRVWVGAFPATPPGAAIVALLLWPSVTWWTAGLGKETLLVGSEMLLVALALSVSYGPPASQRLRRIAHCLFALPIAWLAYRMRYFFALPLLGGLLGLALVRLAARYRWLASQTAQAGALLGLLLLGGGLGLAWAVGQVSEGFYSHQLYEQYNKGVIMSAGRPHLVYTHLAPTAASLLRYAPEAVAHVLLRPWLGEATQPLYLGAALENAGLLLLLGLAGVALARSRSGDLPAPVVVLLLLYCLVIAAFIGLSTPNLGTLHRYRAALLPWLLLLLLQNDYARHLLRLLASKSKT